MKARDLQNIPDVQATPDSRKLAIDKVGVKSIRHPVRIMERSGGAQHTVALFNMYVALPHHFKGTHMSRFVEVLNEHRGEVTMRTLPAILSSRCWRSTLLSCQTESGRPRYRMGKPVLEAGKACSTSSKSMAPQRMGTTEVLCTTP